MRLGRLSGSGGLRRSGWKLYSFTRYGATLDSYLCQ